MEKLSTHNNFRHHLTAFMLLLSVSAFGQHYRYTFRVDQITTPGEAKNITDPLRRLFNDASDPFKTFPAFNDATDEFDFTCPLLVNRQKVEQTLVSLGYTIIEFKVLTIGEVSGSHTD